MSGATQLGLSPHQKLAAARLAAVRRCPYFTAAIMALVPKEAHGLGTIGVSARMVMLWDPAAVEKWSVQACAGVLVHEVGHVLRDHAARGQAMGADPAKFNIASDAEINDDIGAMGLELPDGCVFPKTLGCEDGLTAEEYYRALPPDQQEPQAPGAGAGWCGSAAGHEVPGEPADEAGGGAAGRSSAEVKSIVQQTAEAVRQHAQNGRGSVPGGVQRWAEDALKPPKVRWQDKLARATRRAVAHRAGAVDYRYSRPSRRQAALGFGAGRPVLPALVSPVPRVMVAIDTSGSMGGAELERATAEVAGILSAVGAEVDFVACDAAVHSDVKVKGWREIAKHCKGGGGTDFCPVFETAARKRPAPELLVFATDGCGPAPDSPPAGMRVIWLLVGPYQGRPSCQHGEVAYGDFIEVDDSDSGK